MLLRNFRRSSFRPPRNGGPTKLAGFELVFNYVSGVPLIGCSLSSGKGLPAGLVALSEGPPVRAGVRLNDDVPFCPGSVHHSTQSPFPQVSPKREDLTCRNALFLP